MLNILSAHNIEHIVGTQDHLSGVVTWPKRSVDGYHLLTAGASAAKAARLTEFVCSASACAMQAFMATSYLSTYLLIYLLTYSLKLLTYSLT